MGDKRLNLLAAMLSAFVASAPLLAETPRPGTLETYKDWTIGCDNRNRCEAVSLLPEGGEWPDKPVAMGLVRDAGGAADPEIWVSRDVRGRDELNFLVEGKKIATIASVDGEARLQGPQAAALAIATARGTKLELRVGGSVIGRPSLAGAAAAMRYMDARQGRAGTMAALVATGPLAPGTVRAAPPPLLIRRALIPEGPAPATLWREEVTALGTFTGCADEMRDASPPELYRLSKTETLVLAPCGAGAYNFSAAPVIATGIPGRRSFRYASFDYSPGWSENATRPMLVNASWTPESSSLESYAKGRGLGDCGGSESYAWDGVQFRLSAASAMGECRGAWQWITIWSAKVVQ